MSTPQINPLAAQVFSDPKQLAAHLQSQRARAGAEEFEASLFATVLEKMEKNLSLEDEQNNDAGHDTWGALGVRAVSQSLAQRHVLGIAQMIEHSLGLEPGAAHSASEAAVGSPTSVQSAGVGENAAEKNLLPVKDFTQVVRTPGR